uniref:Uncharacterized protein n=1 Tax=Echinococcus granulosus TaxID=6210 RepID=A0A068WRI7_ECHGR|nr:hypothetical protein EgrG_002031000 [Echinococcus granulosus]
MPFHWLLGKYGIASPHHDTNPPPALRSRKIPTPDQRPWKALSHPSHCVSYLSGLPEAPPPWRGKPPLPPPSCTWTGRGANLPSLSVWKLRRTPVNLRSFGVIMMMVEEFKAKNCVFDDALGQREDEEALLLEWVELIDSDLECDDLLKSGDPMVHLAQIRKRCRKRLKQPLLRGPGGGLEEGHGTTSANVPNGGWKARMDGYGKNGWLDPAWMDESWMDGNTYQRHQHRTHPFNEENLVFLL